MDNKHSENGFSRLVAHSILLTSLVRFSAFLRKAFSESFFGQLLTGNRNKESQGIFSFLGDKIAFRRRVTVPMKRFFAGGFEKSVLLTRLKALFAILPNVQLKCFGIFYFAAGLSLSVAFLIQRFALGMSSTPVHGLLFGIPATMIGGILTASQTQCGEAVSRSRILSLLLFDAMGLHRESVLPNRAPIGRGDVAFLFGIAAGCIGILTSPLPILLSVPLLFLAYAILRQPESGVILLLLSFPFFSTEIVGGMTIFVTGSWLLKVIRGKRIFATTSLDIAVLAFAFVIFVGGLVSVTPSESMRVSTVFLAMMSGYFMTVNLIRTSEWVGRCRRALLFSLGITASVGVAEYLLGFAPQKWLDASMLSLIPGRCVSFFENPNVLASVLLLLLPFALSARSLSRPGDRRFEWTIFFMVTVLCLIFTWSRGGWIGAIVAILVMLLLTSQHILAKLFCGLLLLPAVIAWMPDRVMIRLFSAANLSDSSIAYRLGIWRGTESLLSDCFAGGIGMGETAFRRIYPLYSLSAVETAPHTHNLYSQIIVSVGFAGFLLFVAVMLLMLRRYAAYTVVGKNDAAPLRLTAAAGFAGLCGFLFMGMTDYVWYNNRVVLLFWMVLGLTSAAIRVGESERIETIPDGPHLELDCKRHAAKRRGRKER